MNSRRKELLVKSTMSGVNKIKNEKFALICESKLIEYIIEKDCELVQIGGLLDEKFYGIGLPNSKLIVFLSLLLLIWCLFFTKKKKKILLGQILFQMRF